MTSDKSGCWSRRSSLKKRLIVISILAVAVALGFVIALIVGVVNNNKSEDGLESVCRTQECISASNVVLQRMNRSADPCVDFYKFACGTFLRDTVTTDDITIVTAFSELESVLNAQLRVIVQEPINSDEIQPFQNVKRLYRACINTALIDKQGEDHVRNVIDAMGGWPVLETVWDVNNQWTWQRSVQLSGQYGFSVNNFMTVSVSVDDRNSSRRIIRIEQPSLGMNREYLILNLTEPVLEAYHGNQVRLAVYFGAADSRAESEMLDALNFEVELAKISLSREERRDAEKLYNPMSVQELQNNPNFTYAGHEWLSFFNNILPEQSQLNPDTVVIVGEVSFFEQLGNLLDKTDKRVMANYAAWRQAYSSVSYLPSYFLERQLDASERALQCVETTLSYYPITLGALYVRKHFNAAAKKIAQEMVDNIQEELKIMLTEITWMDNATMVGAKEKAESIRSEIGFAWELLDDDKISAYYAAAPANVREDAYFESIQSLSKASAFRMYSRLFEPIYKTDWSSHIEPAFVNAYYLNEYNLIGFPAGILQGVFFNPDRPQYMNYGGIGFVVGHELTHGFDDIGSQYDSLGNLRNWWANATRVAYLEKARCIINQYGNYVEPLTGLKLNGVNTQGENIADNGGIKVSYRAYQRWAKENPEKRMPGLDYSPQQMFWISTGQVWCSVYSDEEMKSLVTTDDHPPGRLRVNGMMSNMQEFADDFNCPVGTPMNPSPANKCVVW